MVPKKTVDVPRTHTLHPPPCRNNVKSQSLSHCNSFDYFAYYCRLIK